MSSTAPGRRERKKQATRLHIARTAIGMFLARGFDEVSVAEIAEAADVSKVTVFNHFPAKIDMVFELADERTTRPAQAVRDRPSGETVLDAIARYYLDGLDAHAEWTGLHDGVEDFVAMAWTSPTLLDAFAHRAHLAEDELAAVIAEELGEPSFAVWPFRSMAEVAEPAGIAHRVVAAMIVATTRQLTDANIARMMRGQTAAEAHSAARADAERAFALLRDGIGELARR